MFFNVSSNMTLVANFSIKNEMTALYEYTNQSKNHSGNRMLQARAGDPQGDCRQ